MIKLAIIDESELMRSGLRAAMERCGNMQVVAAYDRIASMLPDAEGLGVEVVLADLNWPDVNDFRICQQIREVSPNTKVLALSDSHKDEEMFAALLCGASGYLAKSASSRELLRCVRVIAAAGLCIDEEVTKRVLHRLVDIDSDGSPNLVQDLTKREMVVLSMVAEGYSNAKIAKELCLSISTVKGSITQIRFKLQISSRVELAIFAIQLESLSHQVIN